MAANDLAAGASERGAVGRQTYDRVRELLAASDGMTTRQAFEQVAQETGRAVGAVQTAYYRVARSDPNTTVKRRPRKGAAKSAAPPARRTRSAATPRATVRRQTDGENLVANFVEAQRALLAYVKELEGDRRRLDAIRDSVRQ